MAKFVYRPGLADLDLVTDLGEYLVVMGVNANASDAMNLQYDRGDFEVDADGETVFTGNGAISPEFPPNEGHGFFFRATPDAPFQFSHWTDDTGGRNTFVKWEISYTGPTTVYAKFIRKPELHILRKVEGGSDDSDACGGYVEVSPAQKFYTAVDPQWSVASTEDIRLDAVPLPGYRFVKWIGSGTAWRKSIWGDVPGAEVSLDDEDANVTDRTIYVHLADPAGVSAQSKTFTAVFREVAGYYEVRVAQPVPGQECLAALTPGDTWWKPDLDIGHAYFIFLADPCILNALPEQLRILANEYRGWYAVGNPTPWNPTCAGIMFHDDTSYDTRRGNVVMLKYPLTLAQLKAGLEELERQSNADTCDQYDLYDNNCAVMAVKIGRIAGVLECALPMSAAFPCVSVCIVNPLNSFLLTPGILGCAIEWANRYNRDLETLLCK